MHSGKTDFVGQAAAAARLLSRDTIPTILLIWKFWLFEDAPGHTSDTRVPCFQAAGNRLPWHRYSRYSLTDVFLLYEGRVWSDIGWIKIC